MSSCWRAVPVKSARVAVRRRSVAEADSGGTDFEIASNRAKPLVAAKGQEKGKANLRGQFAHVEDAVML